MDWNMTTFIQLMNIVLWIGIIYCFIKLPGKFFRKLRKNEEKIKKLEERLDHIEKKGLLKKFIIHKIIFGGHKMGQSWSGIKKRLENDLLCDALKGRVQYFITKYRKSHDESGRISILVDGNEIIQGNIFRFYKGYSKMEQEYKSELNISRRHWNGKFIENDEDNRSAEDYIEEIRLNEGIFDVWQFTNALEEFLNSSIENSLNSANPLIRLLAILDRRVGIRTLRKVKENLAEQPEWLQYFYILRLEAEGLNNK